MKKLTLFLIILFAVIVFVPCLCNAETYEVNTSEDFLEKANTTVSGDTIKLTDNIALTQPFEFVGKSLTIDGSNFTVSRDANNWSTTSNNGTLITVGAEGKLTLKNLTLTGSAKYGVQAYNGGHVILNGVTVENCAYGGVLSNGGTIEVVNLHLGKNGTGDNNGIEIAKADELTTTPKLIMNGKLSSTEKDNVVYIAENNPTLKEFDIENTDNSEYKVAISGDKVVVIDEKGTVLFTSNAAGDIEVDGVQLADLVKKEEPKTEPKKDPTPKTGVEDYTAFAILALVSAIFVIFYLKKKEV